MKIYLGIDPGLKSGAYGIIDCNGKYIYCDDIQSENDRVNTKILREQISQKIYKMDLEIIIENVFVMPGQGISSSGKFMRAVGAIETVAELFAPVHFVYPNKWKKALGLTSDKQDSLLMARKLWKDAPLSRKKDNGRAEALLLAEWGRLHLQ